MIARQPRKRRRTRRVPALAWLAILAGALLVLGHAGPARADGDPASDELIAQNVFYPYSSPVSPRAQRQLNAEVTTAHRDGLFLKIALIARPSDLGSITALYGSPQRYAQFLDTELSLNRKIPLLVVMRAGFGTEGLPAALQRAVLDTRPPGSGTGTSLTSAASSAVSKFDSLLAAGHAGRASAGRSSGASTRMILLLALILAALVVGGLLIVSRVLSPPGA
ncbi:MAG TPA: hypothetical protein VMF07_03080 [Solirubrobacteraceae bacterium]|nr:hypothetical protein [Solirubrobacteraceae bacterium]